MPKEARITRKGAIADDLHVEALVAAAHELSEYSWAVVVILLETGMHVSVLERLDSQGLVGDYLQWHRTKGKARGGRVRDDVCQALITPRLREALRVYLPQRRRTVRAYHRFVTEAAAVARARMREGGDQEGARSLEGISPNSLRKTFCLRALILGYPAPAVAKMMGCGQDLVWDVYSRMTPAQLARLQRRLGAVTPSPGTEGSGSPQAAGALPPG